MRTRADERCLSPPAARDRKAHHTIHPLAGTASAYAAAMDPAAPASACTVPPSSPAAHSSSPVHRSGRRSAMRPAATAAIAKAANIHSSTRCHGSKLQARAAHAAHAPIHAPAATRTGRRTAPPIRSAMASIHASITMSSRKSAVSAPFTSVIIALCRSAPLSFQRAKKEENPSSSDRLSS